MAVWKLSIKVWAIGHPTPAIPAIMSPELVVCEEHRRHPLPVGDFFLDPGGRRIITATFISRGHAPPNFETAEYDFTPIWVQGGNMGDF